MKKKGLYKRATINNRRASFDYSFTYTITCGIVLHGSEVKVIKHMNGGNLTDTYCYFKDDELYLKGMHIGSYNIGTTASHEEQRDRKLLLKRRELKKLQKDLVSGMTIIPCKLFENDRGLLKVEIALARGKKDYDKREDIKKKDIERDMKKELNRI